MKRPPFAAVTPQKASRALSASDSRIITPAREFEPSMSCTLTTRAVMVTLPVMGVLRK